MIPFLLLRNRRTPTSDHPVMSYLFLVPGLFSLCSAFYFGSRYWLGDEYERGDGMAFLFAFMMVLIAAICVMKFLMWHGPFKRRARKGE